MLDLTVGEFRAILRMRRLLLLRIPLALGLTWAYVGGCGWGFWIKHGSPAAGLAWRYGITIE